MAFAAWWGILNLVLTVALLAAVVYLFMLIVRALKKYIGSKEVRAEKRAAKRTLGETLKAPSNPMPHDAGVCGREFRRQPPDGLQVGERQRQTPAQQICWLWQSYTTCQQRSFCGK